MLSRNAVEWFSDHELSVAALETTTRIIALMLWYINCNKLVIGLQANPADHGLEVYFFMLPYQNIVEGPVGDRNCPKIDYHKTTNCLNLPCVCVFFFFLIIFFFKL